MNIREIEHSLTQLDPALREEYPLELLRVLNTPPEQRDAPEHFKQFGYVNGKLFERQRQGV